MLLTNDQAKVQLNLCLQEGRVRYTVHFKEELANDGLSMQDVIAVCRSGAIAVPPEPDIRGGDWKYRIEGYSSDGDKIAVVFAFELERNTVFITVFRR